MEVSGVEPVSEADLRIQQGTLCQKCEEDCADFAHDMLLDLLQ